LQHLCKLLNSKVLDRTDLAGAAQPYEIRDLPPLERRVFPDPVKDDYHAQLPP
jgi:hypothetical protein